MTILKLQSQLKSHIHISINILAKLHFSQLLPFVLQIQKDTVINATQIKTLYESTARISKRLRVVSTIT